MLVLGIDPGTQITGYGAVDRRNGRFVCAARGVVRPPGTDPLARRLLVVHDRLQSIVCEVRPDVIAVEDCFYSKNLRSMLKLGHVKGLVLLVAAREGVPVFEYPPRRVKQAVVGNGNASKAQIRFMIERLVVGAQGAEGSSAPFDVTDALAVAVCHHHQSVGMTSALGVSHP